MLIMKQLSVSANDKEIIKNLSLTVEQGEVLSLIHI